MARLKSVNQKIMWAYFTSKGNCMLGTIAETRKESRQLIGRGVYSYKDYDNWGHVCKPISLSILPLAYSTNSK